MKALQKALLTIGIILSLTISSLALAANYTSAINAYERRNYQTAFHQFSELAHHNNQYAQFMLGRMYASGQGTTRDNLVAYKWLLLAAENGVHAAQNIKHTVSQRLSDEEKRRAKQLVRNHKSHNRHAERQPEYARPDTVSRVQKQLAILGYFHDHTDGILGKKTRKAIRKYQKNMMLPADGRLTYPLVESLYLSTQGKVTNGNSYRNKTTGYFANDTAFSRQLRKLIRRGKRRNAADAWFLQELESLSRSINDA